MYCMELSNLQTTTNYNQYNISNNRSNITESIANSMPSGLVRINEP